MNDDALAAQEVRGRAARLSEVVPGAPLNCPACRRRVDTAFSAIYTGTPEDKKLVGWQCRHCNVEHFLSADDTTSRDE